MKRNKKSLSIDPAHFDKKYYTSGGYDDYTDRFIDEGMRYGELLLKRIKPRSNCRFLDVGCGLGGLIVYLEDKGYQASGVEISSFALENSPVKKKILQASVLNLPFEDKSFDVVTCMDVLCYISRDDIEQAVSELTRVSKKYVYIELIVKDSKNSSQKDNPDNLRKAGNLISYQELERLMKGNGYRFYKSLLKSKFDNDYNGIFKRG